MRVLTEKIRTRAAKIGIMGLGYVGLPLAVAFAKKSFEVTGFDVDKKRIQDIQNGISYISDVDSRDVLELRRSNKLSAVASFDLLKEMDVIIICVPTPLRKSREPDLSFIVGALEEVKGRIRKGQLIVLESTTYPGTTDEILLPLLSGQGHKVGEDFFLAFSPERVDPGNKTYQIHNTPKVVGGVTGQCREVSLFLYSQIIEKVVPVSSPTVAELVKLLENTFRAVNIGLINEMAIICNKLGVETGEVIKAAATKPFGFIPFKPGPGLGGHCIPVDPQYLSWKMRSLNYHPRFIQLADEINSSMPSYVVSRIGNVLNELGQTVKGAKILIMGVSYKKDVGDCRESPAFDVMAELLRMGAEVSYHDSYVPKINVSGKEFASQTLTPHFYQNYDCVTILTDHSHIDYERLVQESPIVFDTRYVTLGCSLDKRIVRL